MKEDSVEKPGSLVKRMAAYGGIMVFVIMALEVMIMISPFAFFFYSVFSPFFNFLGQHGATRWATVFFLPHMILPPTAFLKTVRIAGSVFFVAGFLGFIICALQVYLGKIFHWGIASKGLYQKIRHPQYLCLGIWGLGMAILWPRFIVLATLALMFILYYFLARDEERRMTEQYGDSYREYLDRTGRFFPRILERPLGALADRLIPSPALQAAVLPVLIVVLVLGSGFLLRTITLHSLPLTAENNLTVVPILPEDSALSSGAIRGILNAAGQGEVPFLKADKDYLGYLMPADYVMQGMIADTGGHSHLFKMHHTVGLITDWVLHPFAHLRSSPMDRMAAMMGVDPKMARRHHCPLNINQAQLNCDTCPYRRVILVEIDHRQPGHISGSSLLAEETVRTPVGYIDLNVHTGQIVHIRPVAKATAWKDVPTPEI
jgi:protein-S-isoprenylcysteine O-methyltransferase Ste14